MPRASTRTTKTEQDKPIPIDIEPEHEIIKPNGAADIPSPTLGDIADLSKWADDDIDPVRSEIRRVRCSICRPDNFTRFRTWPDKDWWRTYNFLARDRVGQSTTLYLISPAVMKLDLEELEGRTKKKRLIPYVTRAGALGMWPTGLDETNPYVESALSICHDAIDIWACAVTLGREDGEYHLKPPVRGKDYGEPQWPVDLTLPGLLALAFPRDRQILSPDHPELVRLRKDD